LSKIVIVDNIANNFALQPQNGIEIKSWYANDKEDNELQKLYKILVRLQTMEDVRVGI